jgi:homoaconitase/3-isopropylmalate dehydratase large subunit
MYMSGVSYRASREISLDALSDGKPKAIMDVAKKTGLTRNQVGCALMLAWRRGLVLRTAKAIYQEERVFKGRSGVARAGLSLK